MHYLKKKEGKESYIAIKLDMSKAYDRVEWCFLKKVMERMGFNEKWINLIMNCITTVSYSVLINGVVQGCITPIRGLRQGDPISPLGLSTGRSGSGLCPTRNRPDQIGWPEIQPAADRHG